VIKEMNEYTLHGNTRETGPRATNATNVQNVHIALNVALETHLKGKLDAENGDAFVGAAARFNRWREVRSGRVVYV
jgi:hypothetical protein